MYPRMQMPRFQHPLLYQKHVLSEEQLKLACCCLCECSKRLEGPRLCAVWKEVKEQPAEAEWGSNSYTAGSQHLGTAPLCPRFRDAASHQHGLWACNACVRKRVKEASAAVAAAADPAAPLCETDPAALIPHGLMQLSQHPTDSQAEPSQQHQPQQSPPNQPSQQQPSPQPSPLPNQPSQQQPHLVSTRHAKDVRIAALEAEAAQQSAQLKVHLADIAQRSADRKLAVATKAELERTLSEVQGELSSTSGELRALRQAAQRHLQAAAGEEQEAIRRAPLKLGNARQRQQAHKEAARLARTEQRSLEAQLAAMTALVEGAEAAEEGLRAKEEEVERQERKAAALEEELEAASAQCISLEQQQQQHNSLRKRYQKLRAAHANLQQHCEQQEQQLVEAAFELECCGEPEDEEHSEPKDEGAASQGDFPT